VPSVPPAAAALLARASSRMLVLMYMTSPCRSATCDLLDACILSRWLPHTKLAMLFCNVCLSLERHHLPACACCTRRQVRGQLMKHTPFRKGKSDVNKGKLQAIRRTLQKAAGSASGKLGCSLKMRT